MVAYHLALSGVVSAEDIPDDPTSESETADSRSSLQRRGCRRSMCTRTRAMNY